MPSRATNDPDPRFSTSGQRVAAADSRHGWLLHLEMVLVELKI